jgi:urease accessory protein
MTDPRWRVLQIADSGFPTGGFAHSGGLEAAFVAGAVRSPDDLERFVGASLWNVGHAALPFVSAAHARPERVWSLDELVDVQLTNHVANRASRTQGRALLATSAAVFDEPAIALLSERASRRDVFVHLAPVYGAIVAALGLPRRDALGLYLLFSLRSTASAAVRLGIIGPHAAQRILNRHRATLDAVLAECDGLEPAEAATTSPVFELLGATHDRLYARLFQS